MRRRSALTSVLWVTALLVLAACSTDRMFLTRVTRIDAGTATVTTCDRAAQPCQP